ncbi:MAG: hypothetical protein WAP23_03165 [Candidatus Spechtbacterales bacterium]
MEQSTTPPGVNITKDIANAYEARVQMVNAIVENTHKTLDDFRKKREEMSRELRDILAKNKHLRKKDFSRMMEDILFAQQKRETNVKQMLADFRGTEEAVANSFRSLLGKGKEVRIRDFKQMLERIRGEQGRREKEVADSVRVELASMQNEVGGMLDNFKKEREVMASEWKNIMLFLAEKRATQDLKQQI